MSITDELRVYTEKQIKWVDMTKVHYHELFRIADRIDAEHQKALDEWKAENGQMWLKGYSECHAELMEGNETLASDLERCGWVRLPLDADGVPLRVGDEIEYPNGARDTVRFATISPIGWAVNDRGWVPEAVRHHHPPTVEDVLRAMCVEIDRRCESGHIDYDELFAEYAKRLRLAEREDS